MSSFKMTVERDGKNFAATCDKCQHEVVKATKKLAVQTMIGHFAGRHKGDISALLSGDITIDDRT